MKPFGIYLGLAVAGVLSAAEIDRGDSLSEVRANLGLPRGEARMNGRHLLYYERGEVELRDGRVTRVTMLSPEEYAARLAIEQRRAREREARREQRIAQGEALRDRKLGDPAFARAPVAYQVAFWEDFARQYPEVSVAEPLAIARLALQEKLDEQRRQNAADERLLELEVRVAAAERMARPYPVWRHGYHEHEPFNLAPFEYSFSAAPVSPYQTPAGNPAGELRGPLVTTPSGNPAGEWQGAGTRPFPARGAQVREVDDRRDRRADECRGRNDGGRHGRKDAF